MALLDDVKKSLRISASNTAMDTEVSDLIDSAKTELKNTGINIDKAVDLQMDPLIKRAITLYCKANFGYDNPDAQRFAQSYEMLKTHLALSTDYQVVVAVV